MQLGASTSLFCLSQYTIPFCTLSPSDSLCMLLFCSSKDQDVVQIDHHNTFHYEATEDVIHHSLEGSQTVSHPKEHY